MGMLDIIYEGLGNFADGVVKVIDTCLNPIKIKIGWVEEQEDNYTD